MPGLWPNCAPRNAVWCKKLKENLAATARAFIHRIGFGTIEGIPFGKN
jgi:hypothetical protein